MGIIRGALLVFVCILLFMSFLLMGTFATLNLSLEYEIVKPQVNSLAREIVIDEVDPFVIEQQEIILKNYCKNNSEYVFEDANHKFEIPCDVIARGSEAIINQEVDSLIDGNYYREYDCEFWKCFKSESNPFFLVSQHAKDYWKSKYYTFLFVSILLIALVFLLIEKKVNLPILTGILLSVSFIPVSILDSVGKVILRIILSSVKGAVNGLSSIDLNSFILIFVSKADDVFLTGFIIGLILIATGIFLKLLKVGFKIGKFFGKGSGTKSQTSSVFPEKSERKEKKEVKVKEKVEEKKVGKESEEKGSESDKSSGSERVQTSSAKNVKKEKQKN